MSNRHPDFGVVIECRVLPCAAVCEPQKFFGTCCTCATPSRSRDRLTRMTIPAGTGQQRGSSFVGLPASQPCQPASLDKSAAITRGRSDI
jgi:hypothetical protein